MDGNKELVQVFLAWIDRESLFVLWLHVHSPLASVILQHENLLKVNSTRAFHGIGNVKLGDVFQFPFVELGNTHVLAVKVTVIRVEPQ